MSVAAWAGIALAGGLGAVARLLLDAAVSGRAGGSFPWGTLAVNLTGTFALGVIAGAALGGDWRAVAATGLLGSFTTFSTWMLESQRLGEDGERRLMWANLAGSLVLGLIAVEMGRLIGQAL